MIVLKIIGAILYAVLKVAVVFLQIALTILAAFVSFGGGVVKKIGGFTGGDIHDPKFHELLVRWFQFGLFCPVMRLHGFRNPIDFDISDASKMFNEPFGSGADNELYSYGDEVYKILLGLVDTRETMRDYIKEQMVLAHEKGTPVIRPLFYDNPKDSESWDVEDEFMFGPDLLIAPVLYEGMTEREVYLPADHSWKEVQTGKIYEGGTTVMVAAPLSVIPVFTTNGNDFKFMD